MNDDITTIERLPFYISDRVEVLLVYSGVKPASFADLQKLDWDPEEPDSWKLSENEERELEQRLLGIGLSCLRKNRDIVIKGEVVMTMPAVYFGRDPESLNRLLNARSDFDYGVAFGFPETAINAYIGKVERHDGNFPDDVPFDVIRFSEFIKSADNWREELETGQKWSTALRERSPRLHATYLSQSPY